MNQDRLAFVIRIWYEAELDNPQLRGSIQLVASNERAYFSSLDEVPNLLRSMSTLSSTEGMNNKHGEQE